MTLSRMSLTAEGFIAGTLPDLSPERLHGNSADTQSDIWAFGVVLYQMVSKFIYFRKILLYMHPYCLFISVHPKNVNPI